MRIPRNGLVALHAIPGVGWHTIDKLIRAGWSLREGLSSSILEKVVGKPIPPSTVEAIRKRWTRSYIHGLISKIKHHKVGVTTVLDKDYPPLLREIAQPPWVLYYKGDSSLLAGPCIAMVGTRKPTSYGIKVTKLLADQLCRAGYIIVSGMALGIDGIAHQSVLSASKKTVAVLGCGVDVIYPKRHAMLYEEISKNGLIVSEMPLGTTPHPAFFPQRNRIISGLSLGTAVIEAAKKSGSLITANFSVEEGREVFAVPGPITSTVSEGTLHLIQQGAKCVRGLSDILEELPVEENIIP